MAAILSVIFFTMLLWLLWVAVASVALFLARQVGGCRAEGGACAYVVRPSLRGAGTAG